MRQIVLTRGLVALVDDEDFLRFGAVKWHAHESGPGLFYAMRDKSGRKVYLHREILAAAPGVAVDHVNGDRLDCRRENLRLCTLSQNQGNRRRNRRGSSRFKGVTWNRRFRRWCAQITFKRRAMKLGQFIREEDAAHAYDLAARTHFGPFARVNFPRDQERVA